MVMLLALIYRFAKLRKTFGNFLQWKQMSSRGREAASICEELCLLVVFQSSTRRMWWRRMCWRRPSRECCEGQPRYGERNSVENITPTSWTAQSLHALGWHAFTWRPTTRRLQSEAHLCSRLLQVHCWAGVSILLCFPKPTCLVWSTDTSSVRKVGIGQTSFWVTVRLLCLIRDTAISEPWWAHIAP